MLDRTLTALSLSLSVAALAVAPAGAQDTRTYYTARIAQPEVPAVLSASDRELYGQLFRAIDAQRWPEVEQLIAQRPDGLLTDVARAEYYLHANSPRAELYALQNWLQTGTDLPQAAQIGRLAVTRGATSQPALPYLRETYAQNTMPRRTRPRSISDGTMPSDIAASINDRIVNDDPDGARLLLDGVDALLSSEARAEWRQKVAWSYFIENRDAEALAVAQTVGAGSGPWVAEGDWTVGLSAWRQGDCRMAGDAFQRAAAGTSNAELRTASLYWAGRSAMRCRQPDLSARLMHDAASDDRTLYGMLATESLGRQLPERVENPEFTSADWQQVGNIRNVRVAVALTEIGRDGLGSTVLQHQARIGQPGEYQPLTRLARALGYPQTQLALAYNAPSGAEAHPASFYPAPKYAPYNGWQVDPALAFSHILQESAFRPNATSPANAQGLMQITPITVRQHAPSLGLSASGVDIYDPATNLAFGQQNLIMLRDDSTTRGRLPVIMAAYNAGMTPVRRWEAEVNDQGDPLMYMEAIPYWETREYVSVVMRNYWMYERQARATSATRMALSQNGWPLFPDGRAPTSGRVYMSTDY
ncbi:transglycosylase SLT domain-containing protein [Erythrobacter arachoides]|uniref:Transglycosylase SLT domain-containing protein n=2 Tax=Aurantiacibacter arachoides TaxID=1850444 RepID=A0A845A644_9SPHN|nr:transglycosylase SLT domain-containing protein [Aurantiacibacter arachoides]